MTCRLALIESAAATTPATLCPFDALAVDDGISANGRSWSKKELYRVVRDAPIIGAVRHLEAHGAISADLRARP